MDREAKSKGLSDYGRYARPDLKKPHCEVEWIKRLAELLSSGGVPTRREVEYPNQGHLPKRSRKYRDLRLELGGSRSMSIEVKGAWSDYWGRGHKTYRSYLLHPLIPGLDPTKKHTVPFDLRRLSGLLPPETNCIGQLVVGFETLDDPMDADIETLRILAGLSDWREASETWVPSAVSNQRVRCWFWYRSADGVWSLPNSEALRLSDAALPVDPAKQSAR